MRIAAIPIATADLGSDGGVIDGCARVHWRGRAMFPAAGDGSGTFVFRRHLRRSLHVYVPKVRFSGAVPLVGVYLVALILTIETEASWSAAFPLIVDLQPEQGLRRRGFYFPSQGEAVGCR